MANNNTFYQNEYTGNKIIRINPTNNEQYQYSQDTTFKLYEKFDEYSNKNLWFLDIYYESESSNSIQDIISFNFHITTSGDNIYTIITTNCIIANSKTNNQQNITYAVTVTYYIGTFFIFPVKIPYELGVQELNNIEQIIITPEQKSMYQWLLHEQTTPILKFNNMVLINNDSNIDINETYGVIAHNKMKEKVLQTPNFTISFIEYFQGNSSIYNGHSFNTSVVTCIKFNDNKLIDTETLIHTINDLKYFFMIFMQNKYCIQDVYIETKNLHDTNYAERKTRIRLVQNNLYTANDNRYKRPAVKPHSLFFSYNISNSQSEIFNFFNNLLDEKSNYRAIYYLLHNIEGESPTYQNMFSIFNIIEGLVKLTIKTDKKQPNTEIDSLKDELCKIIKKNTAIDEAVKKRLRDNISNFQAGNYRDSFIQAYKKMFNFMYPQTDATIIYLQVNRRSKLTLEDFAKKITQLRNHIAHQGTKDENIYSLGVGDIPKLYTLSHSVCLMFIFYLLTVEDKNNNPENLKFLAKYLHLHQQI